MINCVEQLFLGNSVTMFVNNDVFIIHKMNEPCDYASSTLAPLESNLAQTSSSSTTEYIKTLYPKQKFLPLFFDILQKNNLIDENHYLVNFSNLHVADICTFINNKFGKIEKTDSRFIKMCKYLHSKQIKFPKICVKNPVAQKYLC